jgi:hypothetical protein
VSWGFIEDEWLKDWPFLSLPYGVVGRLYPEIKSFSGETPLWMILD